MKIRKIFLLVMLCIGLLNIAEAQDKYDFAIVKYSPIGPGKIYVSYSNNTYQEILIDKKGEYSGDFNYKVLLEFISTLTERRWEVVNVTTNGASIEYNLKRKKD